MWLWIEEPRARHDATDDEDVDDDWLNAGDEDNNRHAQVLRSNGHARQIRSSDHEEDVEAPHRSQCRCQRHHSEADRQDHANLQHHTAVSYTAGLKNTLHNYQITSC